MAQRNGRRQPFDRARHSWLYIGHQPIYATIDADFLLMPMEYYFRRM